MSAWGCVWAVWGAWQALVTLSILLTLYAGLTFLTVVFVVVKDEATAALTLVAAKCVHTVLLAAPIVLGTFIFVCRCKQEQWVCVG